MRIKKFQSTRPMRDATRIRVHAPAIFQISIHAPHAGRDEAGLVVLVDRVQFQSTRPMRDATMARIGREYIPQFQSTRPMRDATSDIHKFKSLFKTFLMLSQQNFALLVTKSDFTTNKTMFILCKLGVIIKTASSSH